MKIAIRFLTHGRMQTILILFGIAIAISIQIFVGLLIGSLQRTIVDRTLGSSPHITISSANDVPTIRRWQQIVYEVEHNNQVRAFSPSATGNAFIEKGNKNLPVLVRGFPFSNADQIYNISDAIYDGKEYRTCREVLIGRELRDELELDVGDKLVLSVPRSGTTTLTVSGFYDLGVASINKNWLFTCLDTGQEIFDYGNRVTSIELTVKDLFQADTVSRQLGKKLNNDNIMIENWKDQNEELLSGLEGQRISSAIIQIVIIASVVIAIASVLAISVLQKSPEIGILKAMGINDFNASLIFIYEGFLLGLVGSIAGLVLGIGLLYAFIAFTTSPGEIPIIDIYFDYGFVVRSWLVALIVATLAGVIPARKSLKLNPIDVIREG
ncbi:MAG: ABC transporter permease [Dehalococcoidia bacterium]|nr:MAG: ABC transporter permease [Dehalococcoidia bacterium]